MNTNSSNPYPQQPGMYPFPVVPPQGGQQQYMYPQPGQNPYYPYGEPQKEGKSAWGIMLIVLGVLLTGGIALWWWNKNKKPSTTGQKNIKGLYEVQQETIQRLNLTIAEQESEIDRLITLLKESKQLVDSTPEQVNNDNSLLVKSAEQKNGILSHEEFRDSFGLDLNQKNNKKLARLMNEAIDWLIEKQEFFSVMEVQNQYKNDNGCKVNFTEFGIHILWGERKVFISPEQILNGQFYEKYQAFVEEKAQ